ncbi:3922_t:CDS:2 [Paraglomus brasilianum]|uniref:3922_t:CDS:1 n=1 Tax=Paraglomus brasilianum TaxID=144538 RepID=A0A9N9FWY9_9GLOM|nr:3922_t:CDS:2 [Paraglomus brasilianum]
MGKLYQHILEFIQCQSKFRSFETTQVFLSFDIDILHSAADKLRCLELFEYSNTYCRHDDLIFMDDTKSDAICKLICNQKNLENVCLAFGDLLLNETSLQLISKALYTQASSLRAFGISSANANVWGIVSFGQYTNLQFVLLHRCKLFSLHPLQLDAFSRLRGLKLVDVCVNSNSICALLGSVKECLDHLFVGFYTEDVLNENWYTEIWKTCATNTPHLVELSISLKVISHHIPIIQAALPLWQHLRNLSVLCAETAKILPDDYFKETSTLLLLLGRNMPKSVKSFTLSGHCSQYPEELVTFLAICSTSLESLNLSGQYISDEVINALLNHMGHSLKSVQIQMNKAYLSDEVKLIVMKNKIVVHNFLSMKILKA